ncbi:hypothetical protein NM688_g1440 [Phlebia brevispora]|uniref:Uncharacterized protein n=1 Tax=Phlebia brevispora TaxID=194682 RepID=A0ACC1TBB8_9APHY|nr:hypothetical protein NM688_g1440 [Phlebia brevispora]
MILSTGSRIRPIRVRASRGWVPTYDSSILKAPVDSRYIWVRYHHYGRRKPSTQQHSYGPLHGPFPATIFANQSRDVFVGQYDPSWDRLQVVQTPNSFVHIEAPRSWRLWSGWSPRVWNKYRSEWIDTADPMDDEHFDEATAFPTLKPDERIFHVALPNYTRNQRGWYHVKPWRRHSPPAVVGGRERSSTTGADVPAELFDIVLHHMAHEEGTVDHAILMNKLELGMISLVCRRWAKTIRPLIFGTITLRSMEDVHTLLSFLHHPRSFVAHYIRKVIRSQPLTQHPYLPWVHRTSVSNQIVGALKTEYPSLQIVLCGPVPMGKCTKGVCEMLPRSVPWAFIGVTTLELKDLHFKKLGDLMRVPREFPSLRSFTCRNVTWEDSSSEELPPTSQYLSRQADQDYIDYSLRRCTDNRAAAWFTALLAPRLQDRLEQNDAHRICRIASALWQNVDPGQLGDVAAFRHKDFLRPGFRAPPCVVMVCFTARVARQTRRVRAIILEVADYSEEVLDCSDWAAIAQPMVALPSLETLLICIHSRDALPLFHKKVVMENMPNLHGSNKLKYALRSFVKSQSSMYTPVAYSEDKVRIIGRPVYTKQELL